MLKIFTQINNRYQLTAIIKGVSYERKQQAKRFETLQALNKQLKELKNEKLY